MRIAALNPYPAPNHAAACAAYEDVKAVRTEMFNQDVEFQMGIEKMLIATDPAKWVYNHTADPSMELAVLYKQVALYYNDPCQIGHIVKNLLDNRMRAVAEYAVRESL